LNNCVHVSEQNQIVGFKIDYRGKREVIEKKSVLYCGSWD